MPILASKKKKKGKKGGKSWKHFKNVMRLTLKINKIPNTFPCRFIICSINGGYPQGSVSNQAGSLKVKSHKFNTCILGLIAGAAINNYN